MSNYSKDWLCRRIVKEAHDAIIFADAKGLIRLWNTGAEEMFGYAEREALGKSLDLIIPEGLRERHWQGYRRAVAAGFSQYSREFLAVPALRKDGSRISLEFTIAAIRDDEERLLGFVAIIREVTARWEREKALKQRLAELEADRGRPSQDPATAR